MSRLTECDTVDALRAVGRGHVLRRPLRPVGDGMGNAVVALCAGSLRVERYLRAW